MSEVTQVAAPVVQTDSAVTEVPTVDTAITEQEIKQDEPVIEKTFSQAEVDALIQKRLRKAESAWTRKQLAQVQEAQRTTNLQAPDRQAYRDDESFNQATLQHQIELQAEKLYQQRLEAQRQEERASKFQERAEKVADKYADFDSAMITLTTLPIKDDVAQVMSDVFADSEAGADVAYFLAKNPSKAVQIGKMSVVQAARELLKLETELASKPKPASKAPDPINPVGSRGKSSTSLPSDDDDIQTWMRKERERVAKR